MLILHSVRIYNARSPISDGPGGEVTVQAYALDYPLSPTVYLLLCNCVTRGQAPWSATELLEVDSAIQAHTIASAAFDQLCEDHAHSLQQGAVSVTSA